ncbi:hypothetical protein AB0M20_32930 [Actinoplanes sp. NPDC051633]|uniref:hypothetical protein n=1 Tax=Actinoplanes sp. NPDC051633 TaxID=3155670 RepID=UPI00343A64C1
MRWVELVLFLVGLGFEVVGLVLVYQRFERLRIRDERLTEKVIQELLNPTPATRAPAGAAASSYEAFDAEAWTSVPPVNDPRFRLELDAKLLYLRMSIQALVDALSRQMDLDQTEQRLADLEILRAQTEADYQAAIEKEQKRLANHSWWLVLIGLGLQAASQVLQLLVTQST